MPKNDASNFVRSRCKKCPPRKGICEADQMDERTNDGNITYSSPPSRVRVVQRVSREAIFRKLSRGVPPLDKRVPKGLFVVTSSGELEGKAYDSYGSATFFFISPFSWLKVSRRHGFVNLSCCFSRRVVHKSRVAKRTI